MPTATEKQTVEVLGRQMAYIDTGSPPPTFLLLHGNPTSSYLWRDVIAELAPVGRCVAPDLIGMGDSQKLPDPGHRTYTFVEHRRHLDALLEQLDLPPVILVIHDWGSALGFDYARRHPDRVAGIVYMEAIVRPVSWEEWPDVARPTFQRLRGPDGENGVLEHNIFVEGVMPAGVLRDLTDEEMEEYRRPFLEPGEDRRPTLDWPRQLPIDGEPADVVAIAAEYAEFMAQSPIPKLFVNAEPGMILTGAQRETCRAWPNQDEVTVAGLHYIQDDSGPEIGRAIAEWAARCVPAG